MNTTSPEVTGPVEIGLDGKAHLTPKQASELAKTRLADELKQYETQIIVSVYDGYRCEMLTTIQPSYLDGSSNIVGWAKRDIKRNGLPDGRIRSTRIGVKRRKFDGVTPLSSHFNNRFAVCYSAREKLADEARKVLTYAEADVEAAKVALLKLYLEKP